MPVAPTEAIIALSILFLATEIVHKHNGQFSLTEKYPWIVAFAFGLFHGLGFAGALSEIGVPQHEVPLALLMFNVGVETGQLLFIAVVFEPCRRTEKTPFHLATRRLAVCCRTASAVLPHSGPSNAWYRFCPSLPEYVQREFEERILRISSGSPFNL